VLRLRRKVSPGPVTVLTSYVFSMVELGMASNTLISIGIQIPEALNYGIKERYVADSTALHA